MTIPLKMWGCCCFSGNTLDCLDPLHALPFLFQAWISLVHCCRHNLPVHRIRLSKGRGKKLQTTTIITTRHRRSIHVRPAVFILVMSWFRRQAAMQWLHSTAPRARLLHRRVRSDYEYVGQHVGQQHPNRSTYAKLLEYGVHEDGKRPKTNCSHLLGNAVHCIRHNTRSLLHDWHPRIDHHLLEKAHVFRRGMIIDTLDELEPEAPENLVEQAISHAGDRNSPAVNQEFRNVRQKLDLKLDRCLLPFLEISCVSALTCHIITKMI